MQSRTGDQQRGFLFVGNKCADGFKHHDGISGIEFRKIAIESLTTVLVAAIRTKDTVFASRLAVLIDHRIAVEFAFGKRDLEIGIERDAFAEVIASGLADQSQEVLPRHGFGIPDPIRAEDSRVDGSECRFQLSNGGIPCVGGSGARGMTSDRPHFHVGGGEE